MKIAIIDNNETYKDILDVKIKRHNAHSEKKWEVKFFNSCAEFGKSKLKEYSLIISEYNLPIMKGSELMKSIMNKTDASLALMGIRNGWVSEQLVNNEAIKAIIDKRDPNNVIEWISYMENRMELTGYYEKISMNYETCFTQLSELSKSS